MENITLTGKHKDCLYFNNLPELITFIEKIRQEGKTIGYVSGVWDLHHIGHSLYLAKAKEQCGFLIVGVDSDEVTKRDKGENRPTIPFDERASVLTHLKSVDAVIARTLEEERTTQIMAIKPDILIVSHSTKKDGTFVENMEKAYKGICGKIVAFEPQATTSTSARIRLLNIQGAKGLFEQIQKVCEDFFSGKEDDAS